MIRLGLGWRRPGTLLGWLLAVSGSAHPAAPPVAPASPPPAAERSPRRSPLSDDPPPVMDGDVAVAWMHGMQILVKRVPGAEFVSGRLVIRGGARTWDGRTAGLEQLALAVASHGGTESIPRDAFAQRLAGLGANLSGYAEEDFGVLYAKSPLADWPKTFGLLVDAFLQPALPPSEIEVQRQAQLVRLKREQELPDARLAVMAHLALYAGHPYQHRAIGTLESVAGFQRPELAAHLEGLRRTSRLLLVLVGDLDPEQAIEAARAAFGALPRGDYREAPLPPLRFERPRLQSEPRPLPTTYVESLFPAPGWRDPGFAAAVVAMSVLAEREWDEVRTRRNLSYAPSAWLRGGPLGVAALYVTAVDPATTMKVMLSEVRRLRDQPVSELELAGGKSVYLTRFLSSSETTDGQAALLARLAVVAGDWRRLRSFPDEVRAVTAAEVQAFAQRYLTRPQSVVVGQGAGLDLALFDL